MSAFREFYALDAFNFKDTDKFLWSERIPVDEQSAEVKKVAGEQTGGIA
jgi:hypothetical protein